MYKECKHYQTGSGVSRRSGTSIKSFILFLSFFFTITAMRIIHFQSVKLKMQEWILKFKETNKVWVPSSLPETIIRQYVGRVSRFRKRRNTLISESLDPFGLPDIFPLVSQYFCAHKYQNRRKVPQTMFCKICFTFKSGNGKYLKKSLFLQLAEPSLLEWGKHTWTVFNS